MNKRILTVDDSASVRQMVSLSLREAGYDVIEAENGKDALEKLQKSQVDLIVTDLNMPVMDGIELIRQVRSNSSHRFVPIIMLTTESQENKKVEGKRAGATGWIIKPFNPEQLIGVTRKVLG